MLMSAVSSLKTEKEKVRMKKSVISKRTGYPGSGFEFVFVLAQNPKAFRQIVVDLAPEIPADTTATGYCICKREELLRGIDPKAAPSATNGKTDFLVTTHIVALADDQTETQRRFFHEVGHAVDFCADHARIVCREHGIVSHEHANDTETRALLTEFLMSSLMLFLRDDSRHASSGLLNAFPWASPAEGVGTGGGQ